jgi:dihydropteroate synthase
MRDFYRWQLRSKGLDLGQRTMVMGVVNMTPDSFSDGGHFFECGAAIEHALRLLEEGADVLDLGGESTRPGARLASQREASKPYIDAFVTEEEELRRVMPVLQGVLRARPNAVISIDTYKAEVARLAVEAGAEIVNDVSGFQWDARMATTCADLGCGVVLMHTRGEPRQWRDLGPINDVTSLVKHDLANRVQFAFERGVQRDRLVLDPGFGFGKNFEQNYPLLARFHELRELRFPLLGGASRKSFIGRTVAKRTGGEASPAERLYGSLAAMVTMILEGAHIVRVHDVKPAVEAAAVADAVLAAT